MVDCNIIQFKVTGPFIQTLCLSALEFGLTAFTKPQGTQSCLKTVKLPLEAFLTKYIFAQGSVKVCLRQTDETGKRARSF